MNVRCKREQFDPVVMVEGPELVFAIFVLTTDAARGSMSPQIYPFDDGNFMSHCIIGDSAGLRRSSGFIYGM